MLRKIPHLPMFFWAVSQYLGVVFIAFAVWVVFSVLVLSAVFVNKCSLESVLIKVQCLIFSSALPGEIHPSLTSNVRGIFSSSKDLVTAQTL